VKDKVGNTVHIGSRVVSLYTGETPVPVVAIHPHELFVRVRKWDGEDEWLMSRDMSVVP
jgi:hypothetical protein